MSRGRPPFTDEELEYLKKNYNKANAQLAKELKCSYSMIKNYKHALRHGKKYTTLWKEQGRQTKPPEEKGGRDKQMRSYAKELGYTLPQALGHYGKYEFIRMFEKQNQ